MNPDRNRAAFSAPSVATTSSSITRALTLLAAGTVILSGPGIGTARAASLPQGTLHWYRMGELNSAATPPLAPSTQQDVQGTMPLTLSGTGNVTTLAAGPTESQAGVRSTLSLSFNTEGSRLTGAVLGMESENFGFETWVRPTAATLTGLHCLANNGTPGLDGWGLYLSNGQLCLRAGAQTTLVPSGKYLTANSWNHIGLLRTGGSTRLSVNFSVAGSTSVALPPATGSFTLGAGPAPTGTGESFFTGAIDEARYFLIDPATPLADLNCFLSASPRLGMTSRQGQTLASGSTYDVGSTGTGSTLLGSINVGNSNSWANPLKIYSATVTGTDAADFQLSSPLLPATVYGSTFFTIPFRPKTPGTKTATLTVTSNDPDDSVYTVTLRGTATAAPNIALLAGENPAPDAAELFDSSPAQTYGTLAPGGTAWEEKTFTIRNSGLAPLSLGTLSIAGTNSGDYSITRAPAVTSLAPGESTTLTVRFTPTAPGARYGALIVPSSAVDTPSIRLLLTGTGQGADISLAGPDGTTLHSREILGWGDSLSGQITPPAGLGAVRQVAAGYFYTAALREDGTVVVWGQNNQGIAQVPAGLTGVTAIAAGNYHLLALKSDGTVTAWGSNSSGQATVPADLSGVTAIAAGGDFSVALKSDGTVTSWGSSEKGQIPAGLSGVTAIAADSFTLALKSDGTVATWGSSSAADTYAPTLTGVTAIAAAGYSGLALKSDGTLASWSGYDGSVVTQLPASTTPPAAIAARFDTMAVVGQDGTLRIASEDNGYGQNHPPDTTAGSATGPRYHTAAAPGYSHVTAIYDSLVDFGALDPGHTGTPLNFTLGNPGSTTLHLTGTEITGPGEAKYTLSGVPAVLQPGETATFTLAAAPTVTAADTATLTLHSDAANRSTFTVRLTGAAPVTTSPYTQWKTDKFGPAASSPDAADDADPNANGIPNLLEYALGGDPLAPGGSRSKLPKVSQDETGGFRYIISQAAAGYDVTLTLQISDTQDTSGAPIWRDLARSTGGGVFRLTSDLPGGVRISGSIGGDPHSTTLSIASPSAPHMLFRLAASR